jgi:hypothetical protein
VVLVEEIIQFIFGAELPKWSCWGKSISVKDIDRKKGIIEEGNTEVHGQ